MSMKRICLAIAVSVVLAAAPAFADDDEDWDFSGAWGGVQYTNFGLVDAQLGLLTPYLCGYIGGYGWGSYMGSLVESLFSTSGSAKPLPAPSVAVNDTIHLMTARADLPFLELGELGKLGLGINYEQLRFYKGTGSGTASSTTGAEWGVIGTGTEYGLSYVDLNVWGPELCHLIHFGPFALFTTASLQSTAGKGQSLTARLGVDTLALFNLGNVIYFYGGASYGKFLQPLTVSGASVGQGVESVTWCIGGGLDADILLALLSAFAD
jgi:hypothetical protein